MVVVERVEGVVDQVGSMSEAGSFGEGRHKQRHTSLHPSQEYWLVDQSMVEGKQRHFVAGDGQEVGQCRSRGC